MRTLYLDCGMGAAGDMLLAALYELLPDQKGFLDTMNNLGLPGVALEARPAKTCGIAGTHMAVTVDDREECAHGRHGHGQEHVHAHDGEAHHNQEHTHDHHHATPDHIGEIIGALPLPDEVKRHARGVYNAIAAAEARAHGCSVGDVHFHEVGALDAVADVTGVCYALHLLAPQKIVVSPIHVGSGCVRCAHGVMPVPAPATAYLLEGAPCYGGEISGELCTPTGAALLAHFAGSYGPLPPMTLLSTGYGVGSKEFERANCVRAMLGESGAGERGQLLELVCNLDDMSPEALAFACARILEAGALDVYTTPGVMKKGRPGAVLTALCAPGGEEALARAILRETTSNGLRVRRCGKYFLTPRLETVETPYGPIRFKTAEGWGTAHRKPEYADVAAAAQAAGLPFDRVWRDVQGL